MNAENAAANRALPIRIVDAACAAGGACTHLRAKSFAAPKMFVSLIFGAAVIASERRFSDQGQMRDKPKLTFLSNGRSALGMLSSPLRGGHDGALNVSFRGCPTLDMLHVHSLMLRSRKAFQIGDVVIARITVLVMDDVTHRDRTVARDPNRPMKVAATLIAEITVRAPIVANASESEDRPFCIRARRCNLNRIFHSVPSVPIKSEYPTASIPQKPFCVKNG